MTEVKTVAFKDILSNSVSDWLTTVTSDGNALMLYSAVNNSQFSNIHFATCEQTLAQKASLCMPAL